MREPDTCFLQLLSDNRRVHRDIGRVDLHFARWITAGRTLSNADPVRACSAMAKDSYPKRNANWRHISR
jgi:hypothetical protein